MRTKPVRFIGSPYCQTPTAADSNVYPQNPNRLGTTAPTPERSVHSFGLRMQQAEFDYLCGSVAAQTVLAENYVGLPLG